MQGPTDDPVARRWRYLAAVPLTLGAVYLVRFFLMQRGGTELRESLWSAAVAAFAALAGATLLLPPRWQPLRASLFAVIAGVGAGLLQLVIAVATCERFGELDMPPIASLWTAGAAAAGLLAGLVASRRPRLGGVLLVCLVLASVATTEGLTLLQRDSLERIVEDWRDRRWPTEPGDIVPGPSPEALCRPWTEQLEAFQADEWSALRTATSELSQLAVEAITSGDDLTAVLRAHPLSDETKWEPFDEWNRQVIESMEVCPHLQYVDPAGFEDPHDVIGLPWRLGLLQWARAVSVRGLIHAAADQHQEGASACIVVARGTDKLMSAPGILLIDALLALAGDNYASVCAIGLRALGGPELPAALRGHLERSEPDEIARMLGVYDMERLWQLATQRHRPDQLLPPEAAAEMIGITPLPFWYRLAPFPHIAGLTAGSRWREETAWRAWLQEHDAGFAWRDLRGGSREWPPRQVASYSRLLRAAALRRTALVTDRILACRRQQERLPADAADLDTTWPNDPFDAHPLRYQRLSEACFVVYSIGTNGADEGGAALRLTGAIGLDQQVDLGVHLCVGER